jgi:hypothetical protein
MVQGFGSISIFGKGNQLFKETVELFATYKLLSN